MAQCHPALEARTLEHFSAACTCHFALLLLCNLTQKRFSFQPLPLPPGDLAQGRQSTLDAAFSDSDCSPSSPDCVCLLLRYTCVSHRCLCGPDRLSLPGRAAQK